LDDAVPAFALSAEGEAEPSPPAEGGEAAVPAEGGETAVPAPEIVAAPETSGTSTTDPPIDFSYELPTLQGASPAMTAAFDRRVNTIVKTQEKSLAKAKGCKDPTGLNPAKGDLSISYEGSVYAGRYASVTLLIERARPHCSNMDYTVPQSFALDLKAGKAVKLSKFVHPNGRQFDTAVVVSLRTRAQNPDCYRDKKLRQIRPPLTAPSGWNVSDAGVRVWYQGTADVGANCAYLTAFVPWASVLPPSDIRGKKTRTTYWAFDLNKAPGSRYGYTGRVAVARVRGNQVALFEWNLSKGTGTCQVGVRSGTKAIVYQVGKIASGKTVNMNNATARAVPKKYVSNGRKASKDEVSAIFTRFRGLDAKAITRACRL
jgi:hypothetical protein